MKIKVFVAVCLCLVVLMICSLIVVAFPSVAQSETNAQDIPEPQRYYELGMSYFKSDMYEKGLDIMNQVAFLYSDSDVADDALYQLALIRESVGDGKLDIGREASREATDEVLKRLTAASTVWGALSNVLVSIQAYQVGRDVMESAELRAITQYFFALDYLTTLRTRYPQSDRMAEVNAMVERVSKKIEALIPEPPLPPQKPKPLTPAEKRARKIVGWLFGVSVAAAIIFMAKTRNAKSIPRKSSTPEKRPHRGGLITMGIAWGMQDE